MFFHCQVLITLIAGYLFVKKNGFYVFVFHVTSMPIFQPVWHQPNCVAPFTTRRAEVLLGFLGFSEIPLRCPDV
jgi:hypothetical protein